MLIRTIKLAVAVAVMSCGMVTAQDCGCGQSQMIYAGGYHGQDNCGRAITQQEAEGLWSNYCHESCGFDGGCDSGCGCKLGGRFRGLFAGGKSCGGGCGGGLIAGGRTGTCGCDNGCFGYPAGGCGTAGGGLLAGRGCGGCKLGGKLKGLFAGGGCGSSAGCGTPCGTPFSGHGLLGGGCNSCGRQSSSCGCKLGGKLKGLFSGGLFGGGCGGCGVKNRFFATPMGYDYGTPAISSCVSGCATSACGGCGNGFTSAPMPAPAMAPEVGQPTSIIGETMPAEGPEVNAEAFDEGN